MGRFSWLVLVLAAACGDNTTTDPGEGSVDGVQQSKGSIDEVAARYVPTVCDETSWNTHIAGNVDSTISVAGRANGATLLAVPVGGGAMTGFVLDIRMDMLSGPEKIDIDQAFEDVSVTPSSDYVVATAISNGSVYLNLLDTELGQPAQVAKLPGTHIAEPAFFYTQHDFVMPVAGDDGLTLYRFNGSYEYVDSKLVMATPKATDMTAAQLGVSTMAAWSTADDCYMMQMMTYSAGPSAHTGYACPSPRLAVNSATMAGAMVFDSPEGVRLMHTQNTQMGGAATVMRSGTRAPRAVFDGKRFWISLLDPRGDVIVGFLDEHDQFVSMSLAGPNPHAQAYELAMVQGSPWVFSLDDGGYSAYRMCAVPQQ